MKKSSNARIINVSSIIQMIGKIHFNNINLRNNTYTPFKAYSQSKLANVLFTRELANRLGKNSNINVYSLHPGGINTDLLRHSPDNIFIQILKKIFLLTVEMGSQTTLYCALEQSLENETGFYYE